MPAARGAVHAKNPLLAPTSALRPQGCAQLRGGAPPRIHAYEHPVHSRSWRPVRCPRYNEPPMVPATPTPSARLRRAAAAEREELRRQQARLEDARDRLRAELAAVEDSLRELDGGGGAAGPAPPRG